MNSYTHDPISLMTARESRELSERHREQEREEELVRCACGERVHPVLMVEGLCPKCVVVQEEN